MNPSDDSRVAEARRRLAECPADPRIVTMPQHELARLAVRLHGAGQLLDAHVRDRDADPAAPAEPPYATLTLDQEQAATVIAALEDAAALRREDVGYCRDCEQSPAGPCPDHQGSIEAADGYDALRWQLRPALATEPPAAPEPPALQDSSGRQQDAMRQLGAQGVTPQPAVMQCPECGEPAANRAPDDLVPWEAHGMVAPQWSHPDGSALRPVMSPAGGYQPAQPIRAAPQQTTGPDPDAAARLAPPASMRHHWPAPAAAREAEAG